MSTNQIRRAALAAAIFAGVGMAYGVESALQVVYCKATIMNSGDNEYVSVTIPPTEGYYDNAGNPLTYWNVGNVPAGGVADSWHSEGGPGRFTARNAGNVGAYFYVTTTGGLYTRWTAPSSGGSGTNAWQKITDDMFGQNGGKLMYSAISPSELRRWNTPSSYHLAYTTDTMAKLPTWHSLDHRSMGSRWVTVEMDTNRGEEVAGYMGYVDAGDYLTFDLKFWISPMHPGGPVPVLFTFCVEASSFPLWDHGRAVE